MPQSNSCDTWLFAVYLAWLRTFSLRSVVFRHLLSPARRLDAEMLILLGNTGLPIMVRAWPRSGVKAVLAVGRCRWAMEGESLSLVHGWQARDSRNTCSGV